MTHELWGQGTKIFRNTRRDVLRKDVGEDARRDPRESCLTPW